jgi:hypothetical protein
LRKCRQMADDVVGSSQADLGISLFIHDQWHTRITKCQFTFTIFSPCYERACVLWGGSPVWIFSHRFHNDMAFPLYVPLNELSNYS